MSWLPDTAPVRVFRPRALAEDGGTGTDAARARVRTPAGGWIVIHGSVLSDRGGAGPRVAVWLEAARPPELAPLIADAYGLTERERLVTELVAQGFSTNEISTRLHLSAYTVQDHLKSIFEKSGTGSRGDLVARLFFDHYLPKLTSPQTLHEDRPHRCSLCGAVASLYSRVGQAERQLRVAESNARSHLTGANQRSQHAGHSRAVASVSGHRNPVSPALMHVQGSYCQTPALHLYRTVVRSKARSIERLYDRTVVRWRRLA